MQCERRDSHLLRECSKMAQLQYKHRHENVARIAHWEIAKQHRLDVKGKWYKHMLEPVTENADIKIWWDFTLQTDKQIEARTCSSDELERE